MMSAPEHGERPARNYKALALWLLLPLIFIVVSAVMIWRDETGGGAAPTPTKSPEAASQS